MIPPATIVAVSNDESSINRRPAGPDRFSDGNVTYKISTYSKAELQELKRRLESELEHIVVVVSDDESLFSRRPVGPYRVFDGYITYKISTYSKAELRELKRRLESELEHIVASVSDDESSFSWQPAGLNRVSDGYVTYKISTYSKAELQKLKRQLESQLEQVRSIISRSESREIQSSARSTIYASGSNGARKVSSVVHLGEEQFHHAAPRLAAANPAAEKALATMMSKCKEIVAKLMKQKGVLWFNSPIGTKKLNMHDYHPIDLSTVLMHLNQGFYVDPMEFAVEVKQTFNNALLSNPKCHMMHDSALAVNFRRIFDNEFGLAYQKYEQQLAVIAREDKQQRMASWSWVPLPKSPPRAHHVQEFSPLQPDPVPQISPLHQVVAPYEVPDRTSEPDPAPMHQEQKPVMGRMPKAKNLEKRVMSIEEKERLSEGLQSLPQEKMEQVLQIVKKRSNELVQDGDEIELDFEAMDSETLWELDRFVRNCRKIRRYEVMITTDMGSAPEDLDQQQNSGKAPNAANVATPAAKRMKREDADDEEVVDIGYDEMSARNYPSVEIEKDNTSLGSNSSSSSSSGSDSDSSSSDSDGEDEAQSPAVRSSRVILMVKMKRNLRR